MARPESITGLIPGLNKGFEELNDAQHAFDTEAQLEPGRILWFDKTYGASRDGKRARALLQAATLEPETLFRGAPPSTLIETTSTGARTVNIPWKDWGGDAYLNLKGIGAITFGQTKEATEHLNWQIHKRRAVGWNGVAGREIVSQADQEAATFQHLVKHNPELEWDINAPIWRPIAIAAGKGHIAALQDPYFDTGKYGIEQSAVSARRLPYTKHRLDEYVEFHNPTPDSLEGLRKLDSLWNHQDTSHTFIRAAERLGKAYKIFKQADVFHMQAFTLARYKEGSAAWMNFNNIAIDGSVGDLDCGQKVDPESSYVWWQMREAFGSALMYLMFTHRMKPKLLNDKSFLNKFFASWREGIGSDYVEQLKWEFDNKGTFEDVTNGIETFARWFSSPADTRPDGSRDTLGWQNYLGHKTKDIWTASANEVVKAVRKNRSSVGI